jgi:hypothetical protein
MLQKFCLVRYKLFVALHIENKPTIMILLLRADCVMYNLQVNKHLHGLCARKRGRNVQIKLLYVDGNYSREKAYGNLDPFRCVRVRFVCEKFLIVQM